MQRGTAQRDLPAFARSIRAFIRIVTTYPAVWLGFAFVCAWPWSCTSATLVYESVGTAGSPMWTGSNFTYLILGASGVALGLACKKKDLLRPPTAVAIVAGVCYVTASLLFVLLCKLLAADASMNYGELVWVWPVFAGFGQALLFITWVKAFGKVGPKLTIALVVAASIFGSALVLSLSFLPQQIREPLPAIIGFGAAACAFAMSKPIAELPERQRTFALLPQKHRPPWKLLVTTTVAGFSFGVFQSLTFTGSFGQEAWYAFGIAGFFIAALAFALITLVLRMNFNYMVYRFAFVLMATGGFICIAAPGLSSWGYGVFCVGYRCFDMLVWCLCAYLIYHRGISSGWLAGLCVGSLLIGRFLGFEVFTLLYSGPSAPSTTLILATVLFVLMLTALSLVNHNNLLEAWGMAKPGEVNDDAEIVALCCDRLAEQYQLSARERDVVEHLAQNESRAEIGRELVLSEETVKTHIKHIYQKCDIHSRKELEDLIASWKDVLKNDTLDLMERDAVE